MFELQLPYNFAKNDKITGEITNNRTQIYYDDHDL
jgi:hypothetical protein